MITTSIIYLILFAFLLGVSTYLIAQLKSDIRAKYVDGTLVHSALLAFALISLLVLINHIFKV